MDRSLNNVPCTREGMEALKAFFAEPQRQKLWYRVLDKRSTCNLRIAMSCESCRSYVSALIKKDALSQLSLCEIEVAAYSLMQGEVLRPSNVEVASEVHTCTPCVACDVDYERAKILIRESEMIDELEERKFYDA